MCIVCIEYNKGKLTYKEAFRNIREVSENANEEELRHFSEVIDKIVNDEVKRQIEENEKRST